MAKYYNQKVQKQPMYKTGDQVMVNMKNIKTKRPSKKLDHTKLGPIKVVEKLAKERLEWS